ncbi:V4R domain-containing protein [Herbaspirillum sp. RV1423]|uniref:V4R domain-containing protein n=1 Tax=Herbaspirillum sp. RV1423 TaxID=1443993 RepID=UPI0004B5973E|nr:V4R domain-containing protein [Herbaspirillum sp. RV1423]
MNGFLSRFDFDSAGGAIRDGDRRYLMMRHDVLMGAIAHLSAGARQEVLAALVQSAAINGGRSIAAYASESGIERLIEVTCSGAAALGWGVWAMQHRDGQLQLTVQDSPFASGYIAAAATADDAVCAPISGIFASVASQVLGKPASVTEVECRAHGAPTCRFVAATASH